MLRLRQVLREREGLDLGGVRREQPCAPRRGGIAPPGRRMPQAAVERRLAGERPLIPLALAVKAAQHVVERVALEPVRVGTAELRELARVRRHSRVAPGRARREGGVGLGERPLLRREDEIVGHALPWAGPRRDERAQPLRGQELGPLGRRQRAERHRERRPREVRAVVGRGVRGGGDALRSQLDAGEAEGGRELEKVERARGVGTAAPEVFLRAAREGRVVDPEQQVPHPEHVEGRANRGRWSGELPPAQLATPLRPAASAAPAAGVERSTGRTQ